MSPSIVICGFGPGISFAVAKRFGLEGFGLALIARNAERLTAKADELRRTGGGLEVRTYPCDLAEPNAISSVLSRVRNEMGPIAVLHWNAYSAAAGDILTAPPSELRLVIDVSVVGLVASVQELREDLKSQRGAVLVTGGGLAIDDRQTDVYATRWKSAGLAIGKAAQRKTVGLLRESLLGDGVYVGEVVVAGRVKGTSFDTGNATLNAESIAEEFWKLYAQRTEVSVTIR